MQRTRLALLCLLILTGCARQAIVPTGSSVTPPWRIPVYASGNVPFEYEEIGFVSVTEPGPATQEKALRRFREAVNQLGGDAVVNFRLDWKTGVGGFFVVVGMPDWIQVSGLVVKIKRP